MDIFQLKLPRDLAEVPHQRHTDLQFILAITYYTFTTFLNFLDDKINI